jgi:hypothetical protein
MNSQPQRRSMSEALQTDDLPPEAFALIKEGTPKPKVAGPRIIEKLAAVEPSSFEAIPPAPVTAEKEVAEEKTFKPRPHKERDAESGNSGTVSRSFRLPGNLPAALLRASTERRISRMKPFTQEEIVTEALNQWLKRNGYLN